MSLEDKNPRRYKLYVDGVGTSLYTDEDKSRVVIIFSGKLRRQTKEDIIKALKEDDFIVTEKVIA